MKAKIQYIDFDSEYDIEYDALNDEEIFNNIVSFGIQAVDDRKLSIGFSTNVCSTSFLRRSLRNNSYSFVGPCLVMPAFNTHLTKEAITKFVEMIEAYTWEEIIREVSQIATIDADEEWGLLE